MLNTAQQKESKQTEYVQSHLKRLLIRRRQGKLTMESLMIQALFEGMSRHGQEPVFHHNSHQLTILALLIYEHGIESIWQMCKRNCFIYAALWINVTINN